MDPDPAIQILDLPTTTQTDLHSLTLPFIYPKHKEYYNRFDARNQFRILPKPIVSSVVQEINLATMSASNKTSDKLSIQTDFKEGDVEVYKNNPLFTYIKNKNTLEQSKVLHFRNGGDIQDVATLILKPAAKAIAGNDGKAIAMTLSRAILLKGTNADVFYEPEAVAVAGPGGIAHAQSDLEVYYQDKKSAKPSQQHKVTYLPYYGGAKGQTLQITELKNGTVTMEIIQTPQQNETTRPDTSELEMPQLPNRPTNNANYGTNIRNIHKTALNIIKLQEEVKRHGQIDETEYRENLDNLNVAAENLAKIHAGEDDDELIDLDGGVGLSPWFERKKSNKKDKDKKKEEEKRKKEEEERKKNEEEEEMRRKEEEEEKKKKEEEEEKKKKEEKEKEEEQEEEGDDNESVAVNLPPEDASVAEAKPVGLAVAGIGGVAASKPIATAVVGPGGLAIARPVGTAIAGVSPDQALVPIYAEEEEAPSKKGQKGGNKQEKKKIGTSEYLNRIIHRYHQV